MGVKLNTASGGSVSIEPSNTASNYTLTVPAQTGTVATLTTPSFTSTIGVGGATASASGAGITFPATQSASTDANTLDDYEEGTWTPTITGFSSAFSSVTYTAQKGRYIKIGKLVNCQGEVAWSSKSGGSGVFCLAGLPFSSSDGLGNPVMNIQEYNGFTFSGRTQLGGEIFSSIVYFVASGTATTPSGVDVSNVASSGYFYFSFSYIATA